MEPELVLRLVDRAALADGVVRLTLADPTGAELPAWTPGAHVELTAGDFVRQYSLCGSPAERTVYQLAVLRESAGRGGSAWVHDRLAEGAEVLLRGPRNRFALEPAGSYLFVAGGIGITPIVPMVAAAASAGADWRLVYGGRTRRSMAFHAALTRAHPGRVTISPQDEVGHLDLDALAPVPGTLVYCCGPGPLLDAVARLAGRWPAGTLHVERFTPAEPPPPSPAGRRAFRVELARSGRTVTVPADRSVLAALEDAGLTVLSSCRAGTCGTCETSVLSGRVDHHDTLLTPDERAANDTMFICVSRATDPDDLVLDL